MRLEAHDWIQYYADDSIGVSSIAQDWLPWNLQSGCETINIRLMHSLGFLSRWDIYLLDKKKYLSLQSSKWGVLHESATWIFSPILPSTCLLSSQITLWYQLRASAWLTRFNTFFYSIYCGASHVDSSLFIYHWGQPVILLLYADDIILPGTS